MRTQHHAVRCSVPLLAPALVVALYGCASAPRAGAGAGSGWRTDFFDGFDSFEPGNWQDQRIWVNDEAQCYLPDGADRTREVSGGTLKLRVVNAGELRPCDNPDKYGNIRPDTRYVAGRICSKNRQEFAMGRWTARLRLDTSGEPGMFPAWWILGARNNEPPVQQPDEDVYWPLPGSGEIDIFEHHGDGGPGRFTTGAIKNMGKDDGDWWSMRTEVHADLEAFNEYSVEWADDDLVYRVNGAEVYRNPGAAGDYTEPMFAILNYAKITDAPMQGEWTMEVDWVRHEAWEGSGDVPDPRAPAGVRLEERDGAVVLSWEAEAGATYSVYRAASAGGHAERIAQGLTAPAYVDSDPGAGPGFYSVSAVVGAGRLESALSGEVRTAAPASSLPARVQAEAFASAEGTQNEPCTDEGGGQSLGYFDPGDTVSYTVRVEEAGAFNATYRVASLNGSEGFELLLNGDVLGRVAVPATGGWQSFVTVEGGPVTLPEGEHTLTLRSVGAGWNINWFELAG